MKAFEQEFDQELFLKSEEIRIMNKQIISYFQTLLKQKDDRAE